MSDMDELAAKAGLELFPYQRKYLEAVLADRPQRTCLYYRTGAGKSFTSLAGLALQGYEDCMVVAPPSTHKQWEALARLMDMDVLCMSHAKFRMSTTKMSRHLPVVADEFHMFGGQTAQGWRKLDALARHLKLPMVLMSATPNYNDAERVYCISHILDPKGTRGGYLQFLYTHCTTEQSHFSASPIVTGFKHQPDAASFLAALPNVYHLPDERVVDIVDIPYDPELPSELDEYGYDRRRHRMVASQMEMRHTCRHQGLVDEQGLVRPEVLGLVLDVLDEPGGVLVYANHAAVALALSDSLHLQGVEHKMVTGATSKRDKDERIQAFNRKWVRVLVGTASLATGTDGMDRVCDTLLIVDDTDDDALRRQLIGRILPRGELAPLSNKRVFRLIPV